MTIFPRELTSMTRYYQQYSQSTPALLLYGSFWFEHKRIIGNSRTCANMFPVVIGYKMATRESYNTSSSCGGSYSSQNHLVSPVQHSWVQLSSIIYNFLISRNRSGGSVVENYKGLYRDVNHFDAGEVRNMKVNHVSGCI